MAFPPFLSALTRPGRFDTHVRVPLPDVRGREKILRAHSKDVPLAGPGKKKNPIQKNRDCLLFTKKSRLLTVVLKRCVVDDCPRNAWIFWS